MARTSWVGACLTSVFLMPLGVARADDCSIYPAGSYNRGFCDGYERGSDDPVNPGGGTHMEEFNFSAFTGSLVMKPRSGGGLYIEPIAMPDVFGDQTPVVGKSQWIGIARGQGADNCGLLQVMPDGFDPNVPAAQKLVGDMFGIGEPNGVGSVALMAVPWDGKIAVGEVFRLDSQSLRPMPADDLDLLGNMPGIWAVAPQGK